MKKKLLLPILAAAAICLAGCSEDSTSGDFEYYGYVLEDGEEEETTVSNGSVSLKIDKTTTQFVFTDKNGTEWYSVPPTASEKTKDTTGKTKSNLLVEYSTSNGVTGTYDSFSYSVEKGLYQVETVDSGDDKGFDINYTIGNINREFFIPIALPESEMQPYIDKMKEIDSKSYKKYVKEYYKVYDIKKLSKKDDKNELLEKYPELENEKMYVFITKTPDHMKAKAEELFEQAGYTEEDYRANVERYGEESTDKKCVFNITLSLRLDGDQLVASIPFDKIQYTQDYIPIHVDMLPYMAAGEEDEEGFLFVPDGNGALIDFNNGKVKQSPYNARVYGWDDAKVRNEVIDDSVVNFPVFGVSHAGKGSLLCVMEDGKSYGTIEADVAGRLTNYNFVFASYDLVQWVDLDVSAKSDSTVRTFDKGLAEGGVISQRYYASDSDSYVEMAKMYRNYLMENEGMAQKDSSTTVPVVIEAIGAVDMIDQVCGVPTSISLPLTTYDEANAMLTEIADSGIGDFSFKYNGWCNGGVQNKAGKVKLVSKLGSSGDLKDLAKTADSKGVDLYLAGGFNYAYRDKLFDSYSVKRDSAKYIGREVVEKYPYSSVWFGEDDDLDSYYLTQPQYAIDALNKFKSKAADYGADGVALEDIGYKLNSDFNPKKLVTREQSMEMQMNAMKDISAGSKLITKGGNDYSLAASNVVTDVWLESKLYNIEDASVPFFSIAIHGLVDYTGTAINLSNDYKTSILNSVENGAGLYYSVMSEGVDKLSESEYTNLYGADYSKWSETITEDVNRIRGDLNCVASEFVKDHTIITKDVRCVEYENGVSVIVNYGYDDYDYNGTTVKARDFVVIGGDK